MKVKRYMNNGLMRYLLGAAFAAGVAILTGAGIAGYNRSLSERGCNTLEVTFEGGEPFLEAQEVMDLLEARYGTFIGLRIQDISLNRIEAILDESGPVKKSEAWMSGDGTLHVSIEQRQPVLRFSDGHSGYYIDADGTVFPLHPTHTASVPVVAGQGPDDGAWRKKVLHTYAFLQEMDCQVDSLCCNTGGELTLIGAQGEQILLGQPGRIEEQYPLLQCYYNRIVPQKGAYKTINLKYRQQIICRPV